MFGHQNDQQNQQQDDNQHNDTYSGDATAQPAAGDWQAPSMPPPLGTPPVQAPTDNPAYNPSVGAPADSVVTPDPTPAAIVPASPAPAVDDVDANDLLDIKQHALTQLSPLVGHLDQTPEEKFRTTMMMIQASDNQTLVKDAYEAAQQIGDEKARAQALLDVINEINYFTQHHEA